MACTQTPLLLLLMLSVAVVTVVAQRRRPVTSAPATDEWNYRDGADKVSMRGVSNLTHVLDNWRFDILTQIKSLLANDHQSLLPDYARIQPLSEALDDLYKEFNALKSHLGDLTEKVAAIETFVDDFKANTNANANANANTNTNAQLQPAANPVGRQPGRRVVKRKNNVVNPQT